MKPVHVGCMGIWKASANDLIDARRPFYMPVSLQGYSVAWKVDIDKAVELIEKDIQRKFTNAKKSDQ